MENLDSNFIAALLAAAMLGALFVISPALALLVVLLVCAEACSGRRARRIRDDPMINRSPIAANDRASVKESQR
jgi:hypothetical protein